MSDSFLELRNLKKSFTSEEYVLQGINLQIDQGEFVTLLGASGCGKTTTLRIIAGLEQPDSGSVWLEGKDVITDPKTPKSNRVIQMPQFLCDELQDYLKQLYGVEPDSRMFPISKSYLHREMDRGCKANGSEKDSHTRFEAQPHQFVDRHGLHCPGYCRACGA